MMCSAAGIFLLIFISFTIQLSSAWEFPSLPLWTNSTRLKRQAQCDDTQYRCKSGQCVHEDLLCDGIPNCGDGSDETKEECSNVPCAATFFRCKYGACINKKLECDGKRDCADNSDEVTPRCKRDAPVTTSSVSNGNCGTDFQCKSGQCVSTDVLCDGKADCDDGSDETREVCSTVPCPSFAFKCAYGGCVNKQAKCNGVKDCADGSDEYGCPTTATPVTKPPPKQPQTSDCLLPPHPRYGRYNFLASDQTYTPNIYTSENTVILGSCNTGFKSSNKGGMYCSAGTWIPEIPEQFCIPRCKSLKKSHTYTIVCKLGGEIVDCDNAEEGTMATSQCNDYYTSSKVDTFFEETDIRCLGGSWSRDPDVCTPVCGQKYIGVETLILGGAEAKKGEYPWVVAVYNASNEHICGGSIIHEKYVLSAAHCFSDQETGALYNSNDYKIAAGTYYRNYNDARDPYKRIINVQGIYTPNYRGGVQQFASDIALLKLQTRLTLSKHIQPVCLDKNFNDNDLVDNVNAVVVGWGFTTEGGSPSETQKKLVVPYRLREVCTKELPPEFGDRYYTYDKMCAGYIDKGTSVCSGDSGGGLFFQSYDKLFYVRGIVSLSPPSAGGGCSSNHFALYTKVSVHTKWIADKIKATIMYFFLIFSR